MRGLVRVCLGGAYGTVLGTHVCFIPPFRYGKHRKIWEKMYLCMSHNVESYEDVLVSYYVRYHQVLACVVAEEIHNNSCHVFCSRKGPRKGSEAGVWGPPLKKGQSVVVVAKDRRSKMGGVGCTVHSTRLLSHRGGFMFKYYGTVDRH